MIATREERFGTVDLDAHPHKKRDKRELALVDDLPISQELKNLA